MKEKLQSSGQNDFDDIADKLYKLDPSAFRQTMKDLNFDGTEPEWAKREVVDGKPVSNDVETL